MQRDTTRLHRDPKQLQRDKKNDYGDKKHLKRDVNDHKVTKPPQGYSLKWLWRDVNYHRNATQLRRGTIYHKKRQNNHKETQDSSKGQSQHGLVICSVFVSLWVSCCYAGEVGRVIPHSLSTHTAAATYINCSGKTARVLSTVRLRGHLWGTASMCVQCTTLVICEQ